MNRRLQYTVIFELYSDSLIWGNVIVNKLKKMVNHFKTDSKSLTHTSSFSAYALIQYPVSTRSVSNLKLICFPVQGAFGVT